MMTQSECLRTQSRNRLISIYLKGGKTLSGFFRPMMRGQHFDNYFIRVENIRALKAAEESSESQTWIKHADLVDLSQITAYEFIN